MACTSCKKKKGKGIGALSSSDEKELKSWGIMATAAFVSKLVVNPVAKLLYKTEDKDVAKRKPVPTQFPIWVKGISAVALWMHDEEWSKTAAKGVATVAAIEALEFWQPDIFKNAFVSKGGTAPQTNPGIPISTKIVDKLMKVNKKAVDTEQALKTTDEKVSSLADKLTEAEKVITNLGEIKGDVEIVPYAYDEDTTPEKPTEGVQAADFFAYVMGYAGVIATPGRKFSIQLSGDVSIPMMVNGVLQSGNANENLFVAVKMDGTYAYVYQGNKNDEKFATLADQAKNSTEFLIGNYSVMETLETRLDAI
jgi:hypothetical protein